jgi:hypothetical protein
MPNSTPSPEAIIDHAQATPAGRLPEPEEHGRALISSSASADTSVLREVLRSRGLAPYELDEISAEGRALSDLLEDCLKETDLVVAVLDGNDKERVLVELGFAWASRKRLLALVAPGEELPFSEIPHLRARPDSREALEFWLDQVLAAPPRQRSPCDAVQKTRPLGPLANDFLVEVRRSSTESELREILRRVLESSGVSAVGSPADRTSPPGADFAVWSEDFEPWIGNPLVIEASSRGDDRKGALADLDALSAFLEKTHTQWGLMVCRDTSSVPEHGAERCPNVFIVSVERLLETLSGTSLGDFLREMRNQRIRGRG